VCDHLQAELLHSQRFVLPGDKSLTTGYDVVVCERCGAAFADTPVSQQQYDDLYAERSRYAAGPAAHASDNDRDFARFRDMALDIDRMVADKSARVLDVGCANGQMLAALSALGYRNLCGVDPSPGCVQQALSIPGVSAIVGSLSHMPDEAGPFDVLILSHVLEHVRDVKPALHYLERFVSAHALIYVEVPDASRYVDFAWSPFQDFNSEHINHFSLVSLENLLRQCGLRPGHAAAKEILSAPGMPYPAIYCFAAPGRSVSSAIEKDVALKQRLQAYVRVSAALMEQINARLAERLAGSAPVIVWGTGELTAKLLADTALAHANVVGFVDSNPINQGQLLRGLPILAPTELVSGQEIIVVASILHHKAILHAVRTLGLGNPVLGLREIDDGTPEPEFP
jgi:2-polyprenyl-3-methyl-5-hydroxy-6-metoxy-1,4-benzoquinol methylase